MRKRETVSLVRYNKMKADTLTKVASSNNKSIWQDLIGFIGVSKCGEYDIVIRCMPRRSYIGRFQYR
jgi:hypothetical protein